MKKIISIMLAVLLSFSIFSFNTFASDKVTDKSNEYIHFSNISLIPSSRMDELGDFTFEFSTAVTSDYFIPRKTSITISCITTSNTKAWYVVTLYNSSGDSVGSFTGKDNGTEYSKSFDNLDTSKYYHFKLTKYNYFNDDLIIGSGHVTNLY